MTQAPPCKNGPYKVVLEEGKTYYWCTCGHSSKQPFCDGTHKTVDGASRSLAFVAKTEGEVFLCGCKETSIPPYCDGTHNL